MLVLSSSTHKAESHVGFNQLSSKSNQVPLTAHLCLSPALCCSPAGLCHAGGQGIQFNCILQILVKLQAAIKNLLSSSLKGLTLSKAGSMFLTVPVWQYPLALLGPSATTWGAGRACVNCMMGEFHAANAEIESYCSADKHNGKTNLISNDCEDRDMYGQERLIFIMKNHSLYPSLESGSFQPCNIMFSQYLSHDVVHANNLI